MPRMLFCADCTEPMGEAKPGGSPLYCPSCRKLRKRAWDRDSAKKRREGNPEAVKAASEKWRRQNPDKIRKKNQDFYAANQAREKDRAREWRLQNPDKCKAANARWLENNQKRHRLANEVWFEKNKEYRKEYRREQYHLNREDELAKAKEWKSANKDVCAAQFMKRKAAKLRATPPWADEDAIKAIYAEARRLTVETGVQHHVDHTYPLQSDWVCGLHVETNLQILTASGNQSKSNRRHPEHHPN